MMNSVVLAFETILPFAIFFFLPGRGFRLKFLPGMLRTRLYADPHDQFLHQLVLDSCQRNGPRPAIVDCSCGKRLTYAEYGDTVESLARGLVATGVRPGDLIAIFLFNCWEFCVAFHAAQLAGAIPTLLNPTYREREVR